MYPPRKAPPVQRRSSIEPVHNVTITVVVRCRPMNEEEVLSRSTPVVELEPRRGVIFIDNPRTEGSKLQFTYDSVYDENTTQEDLYDGVCRPITDAVLDGYNGTVFAYGQTGTGKTYTIEGSRKKNKGIIPNTFEHLFNQIARSKNHQYLVSVAYLEIYKETIRDLLDPDKKNLPIRETSSGIGVSGLTSMVCKGLTEIEKYFRFGKKNRTTSRTRMNEHSSRSHAIFMITVECSDSKGRIKVGRLNLVDLAGSERQSKSGTMGDRLKETAKINLSLSALGNVISALSTGKSQHIPYRDSKLTRLLQDSLGGNSLTVMIANIGPSSINHDETLTTLRYANRAKNIKNVPQVNEDPKDAKLREYQEEIHRLKTLLVQRQEEAAKRQSISSQPSTSTSSKKRPRKLKPAPEKTEVEDVENTDPSTREDLSANQFILRQMEKLNIEKTKIVNDKKLISAEKDRLLKELEEKSGLLEQEQSMRESLLSRIESLESQLLRGGKTIIDHTNEQERALECKRQEIAEQKRKEVDMLQKLEDEDESALDLKETFSSLQQESESKSKKLKKMFAKLESIQQEIRDVYDEANEDRREMEANQKNMLKELKLLYLIIENFIPVEEKNKLLNRIRYDNEDRSWFKLPLDKVPVNVPRLKSSPMDRVPRCDHTKSSAIATDNPRYKYDNVIPLDLEMPLRTTKEYEINEAAQAMRAVLQEALEHENAVLEINCNAPHLTRRLRMMQRSRTRPPSSLPRPPSTSGTSNPPPVYPVPRGLVPK